MQMGCLRSLLVEHVQEYSIHNNYGTEDDLKISCRKKYIQFHHQNFDVK
jgi:hypothetical protein